MKKIDIHSIEKKYLVHIIICMIAWAIGITIISALYLNYYPLGIINDVTLVVEIGFGVTVTLIVYGVSRRSEIKIDDKITDVLDIVKARDEIQKEKESQVRYSTLSAFNEIMNAIEKILVKSESYESSEDSEQQKSNENQIILDYEYIRNLSMTHLDDSDKISSMFFNPSTVELIKTISSICKNKPDFTKKMEVVSYFRTLSQMITPVITELSSIMKPTRKTIQESLELEESVGYDVMTVSSDRTVYPIDSTMHMRANLPYVIEGEKILFEVFNSKKKLLLSQIVDPANTDYPDLAKANIFQACFKMDGKEWKIGKSYTVRATYGSLHSEDSFLVAQRTPVLQSDKSVYMINSDMILTVIDPDADKDNEAAEYVGDTEYSKLIIESKSGKINGYKLRETGDSTGIFQGIVGILGARKDGTIIPRNVDGKIIDKIQGSGIEDGFIAGELGEEITISYKNKTDTTYLTIFVSNFGASVEMDKKIYKSTDKICLKVVAPDFTLNSNTVNEIGQTPESAIRIRTSKDELVNYKLIETGSDTGIFTGEIQLTEVNDASLTPRTNLGSTDGILRCSDDDFIEVIFNFFDTETITCKAMIKNKL